jgi:predicted Rdx family selenoprotein
LEAQGFAASIAEGSNGQFDVVNDGALVFSKKQERRWPEPGEVLSLLQG